MKFRFNDSERHESNFLAIQPIVVETFPLKPTNIYLLMALEENLGDQQTQGFIRQLFQ